MSKNTWSWCTLHLNLKHCSKVSLHKYSNILPTTQVEGVLYVLRCYEIQDQTRNLLLKGGTYFQRVEIFLSMFMHRRAVYDHIISNYILLNQPHNSLYFCWDFNHLLFPLSNGYFHFLYVEPSLAFYPRV